MSPIQRNHRSLIGNRRRSFLSSSAMIITVVASCCILFFSLSTTTTTTTLLVEASSAAGSETLIGIVGKDFILLGADSSVSQSIALTVSNVDKITPLIDPFPNNGNGYDDLRRQKTKFGITASESFPETVSFIMKSKIQQQRRRRRQQTIVAAAAGDAADSDKVLSILKAYGTIHEYNNGGLGCDVRWVATSSSNEANNMSFLNDEGLDVRAMAHFARRHLWENLRTRPLRVCLLIAGMMWVDDEDYGDDDGVADDSGDSIDTKPIPDEISASHKVQKQVRQALSMVHNKKTTAIEGNIPQKLVRVTSSNDLNTGSGLYQPHLYWLDEYGSLQKIQYGAHGHGANFLLSVLDQSYRPDLTRAEAVRLMEECFQQLRSRYVVNSPEAPCIKCVDTNGVRCVKTGEVLDEGRDDGRSNMLLER